MSPELAARDLQVPTQHKEVRDGSDQQVEGRGLEVTLPKREEAKAKKVKVEVK